MAAYTYVIALAVISVFVMALERFFPLRKQPQLRRDFWSDVVHLVFNAHFLGVLLYGIAVHRVLPFIDVVVGNDGFTAMVGRNVATTWPVAVQIIVALVVVDFLQWCVHNLLHRVPFLWPLHQTHHSVKDGEMDWIVSFRFQWAEVVVYKSLLYVPLAFFGFGVEAMMFHAIFGTLIGHLNHANLDLGHGWWRYILNSPRMHIWHHDRDGDLNSTVNFGIIFSTWDWIFGTARMPDTPPQHIGFKGDETFPTDFFAQAAWPLPKLFGAAGTGIFARVTTSLLGVGVIAALTFLSMPKSPTTPLLGEVAASSQPANANASFDYPDSVTDADAALGQFGDDAKRQGYAHPEDMVSVDEVARALTSEKLVLLDVRPKERFVVGHVPGARSVWRNDYSTNKEHVIPGLSLEPDALMAMLAARGVEPSSTMVLYGDGGPEPYRLWWTLKEVLDVDVRVMEGGLGGWKSNGHGIAEGEGRTVASASASSSTAVFKKRDASLTTSSMWKDIAPLLEKPGVRLFDTRTHDEFIGAFQHKESAQKGRIPGSRHLEWTSVMEDESGPHLKSPEALRVLFTDVGVAVDDSDENAPPVIVGCQSGTRSAAVYFALHQLGIPSQRIFNHDGSFAEYSRLALPVATGPDLTNDTGRRAATKEGASREN